jgi:hypothetical protein
MNVLLTCFYTFSEICLYFVEQPDENREKNIKEYTDKDFSLSALGYLNCRHLWSIYHCVSSLCVNSDITVQ